MYVIICSFIVYSFEIYLFVCNAGGAGSSRQGGGRQSQAANGNVDVNGLEIIDSILTSSGYSFVPGQCCFAHQTASCPRCLRAACKMQCFRPAQGQPAHGDAMPERDQIALPGRGSEKKPSCMAVA